MEKFGILLHDVTNLLFLSGFRVGANCISLVIVTRPIDAIPGSALNAMCSKARVDPSCFQRLSSAATTPLLSAPPPLIF